MRHFKNLCVALTFILCVALGYSWVLISRKSLRLTGYQNQVSQDRESIRKLQKALHVERLQKARAEASGQNSEAKLRASLTQSEAALRTSGRQLSAAEAQTSNLQGQLSDTRREYREALAKANDQIREEKRDIQAQLAFFKQQLKSAHVEAQTARLRVEAVEAVDAKLVKEKSAGSDRTAAITNMIRSLQNLDRQREAHVASLTGHYQDISNQMEAMRGMLDANRDSNANAFSSEALDRIRNAMSLADNDLRELSNLNGEIRQLEKRIAEK